MDLTLAHEVSPQPPRVGPATIVLTLTDASGTAVSGARFQLEGNMSHPGMTPVFAEAAEVEPGRYRANLELSMAGDWHVAVQVTLRDGRKFEREFEIKGVASG
ncbi:MAG TPA: FixH family protein [Pyrinomonadaceae bacterium]|nr:FixH family protein [Pyrinomonadaceae bacterium]